MEAHKYPKPLWNSTGTTITLEGKTAEGFSKKVYDPGEIIYAPNGQYLEALGKIGFSDRVISLPFPKALHGPDGQSLSVKNEDELQRALKVGWSLKPVVEEDAPVDAPPSPDVAPKRKAEEKRAPGRPKVA